MKPSQTKLRTPGIEVSTIQISHAPVRPFWRLNARRLPSGAQVGWTSSSASKVICVGAPPAIGIVKMSQFPLRFDANATVFPSGEIDGMRSSLGSFVSCVTVRPSIDFL